MAQFIQETDKKMVLLLKDIGIKSRFGAKSGILLASLLPSSFILSRLKLELWNESDKIYSTVCFGLLLHFCVNILYMRRNNTIFSYGILFVFFFLWWLASFLFAGPLIFIFLTLLSIFLYEKVVLSLMRMYPNTFTFGESSIVSQGIVLFLISCIVQGFYGEQEGDNCFSISTAILQVGLLILIVIAALSYGFNLGERPAIFYATVVTFLSIVLVPATIYLIGKNPYTWILKFIFSDWYIVGLLVYWCCCSICGILIIAFHIVLEKKASTVMRKSFHFLTVMVFLPGLVISPCFLYLASGVVLAIFLGLDLVRTLQVEPLGKLLEKGFESFADDKDCGTLALTPVYLLVGCSLPLWIHPDPSKENLLPLLSGILTVGIGDSAASLCGTLFGRNKWPGSHKTKEGTAGCFIAQLFFIIALIHFGYIPRNDLIRPVIAILVTSFAEAVTDQVDNLVLPLLMYIFVA